jgi:hypothetical protein
MHPELSKLSHSSRLTLHECPRRFQLYRLARSEAAPNTDDEEGTFGFGHLVGSGIQNCLIGKSLQQVIWEAFLAYTSDLFYLDDRRKKSFWHGVFAIKKFFALRSAGFLKDYELVYYDGKPACELGFRIHLPGNFSYRGYVDVVLKHKTSGEVLVLEIKTSSWPVVANAFKNSGQALGYSVVLDHIFLGLSSYKVLYLVYKTREYEFEPVEYTKTLYQRALWLNELLLDTQNIQRYSDVDVFPMHGENCINKFGKECKFFGLCTMNTASLVARAQVKEVVEESYDFEIPFEQLVNTQLGTQDHAPQNTQYIPGDTDVTL